MGLAKLGHQRTRFPNRQQRNGAHAPAHFPGARRLRAHAPHLCALQADHQHRADADRQLRRANQGGAAADVLAGGVLQVDGLVLDLALQCVCMCVCVCVCVCVCACVLIHARWARSINGQASVEVR